MGFRHVASFLKGQAFGLAAGPRAELQAMLRGMTLEAGVPRSGCGGAR